MGFNSKEYKWTDLDIAINGKLLTKCQSVEYTEKVETEKIRGKGNKAYEIADGNVDVSGSIEVLQSDLETLMLLTGNKGVLGLRDLTITVAYKNIDSGRLSTRSIIGARITEIGEPIKQGEMKIVCKLPFEALDIIYPL
jgi:hypothetical protein